MRVLSALEAYGVDVNVKVVVREVSPGGFSVASPVPFAVGEEQTLLFSAADGSETMVRCTCRHSRTLESGGAMTCVAGFQFLPGQDASLKIIIDLYAQLRRRGLQS